MAKQLSNTQSGHSTRRTFLKTSSLAIAGTALAGGVHAGGNDVIRVGLIGCGGRGTGAAGQALNADPNVKLIAMGDVFADKLQASLSELKSDEAIAKKVDVRSDHCFVGFDAYKQVLATPVDVVLLTTPLHFRPIHFKAAVEAGKHIFAEKPVAVDAPGIRAVMAACEEAKRKNLAVVSGLCYRYEHSKQETMKRVHEGAVGDILALHTSYNMEYLWNRARQKDWSDMEWQLRNWLYFTWLSGDHIVEQHVHSLDKMAWAMGDQYPVKASGMGGRQTRTSPAYGHIFDHHAVVFEFQNGVKCFSFCRQQNGCAKDITDHIIGTKGICHVMDHRIVGDHPWHLSKKSPKDDMYQNEHDEMFASLRAGRPIYNGDYMCKSSLMGIMGRMATYTGINITWEMALNSKEDLSPKSYEFGAMPMPPVAKPGITKFV